MKSSGAFAFGALMLLALSGGVTPREAVAGDRAPNLSSLSSCVAHADTAQLSSCAVIGAVTDESALALLECEAN